MRVQIMRVTLSFACFLAISHPVVAGRVDVVNENKKALSVRIKAEGDNIGEDLATYIKEIPAEHYFKFMVESSDLKGKSHYSIKGDTSVFTPGGKCDHLSVDKDYKVTFLNDATGTSCIAEEIK